MFYLVSLSVTARSLHFHEGWKQRSQDRPWRASRDPEVNSPGAAECEGGRAARTRTRARPTPHASKSEGRWHSVPSVTFSVGLPAQLCRHLAPVLSREAPSFSSVQAHSFTLRKSVSFSGSFPLLVSYQLTSGLQCSFKYLWHVIKTIYSHLCALSPLNHESFVESWIKAVHKAIRPHILFYSSEPGLPGPHLRDSWRCSPLMR